MTMTIELNGYNFVPVIPGRKGVSQQAFKNDEIVFATDMTGRSSKLYAVRIGVPAAIAKEARLIPMDRVLVAFDRENKCGLIQRIHSGGHSVSKWNGSRHYIKFNHQAGMPTVAKSCGCPCEVTSDGIIFMLPDCVSFDRNLRAEADGKK